MSESELSKAVLTLDLINKIHDFYVHWHGFPTKEGMYYSMYHCRSPLAAALDADKSLRLEDERRSVEDIFEDRDSGSYHILKSLLPQDLEGEENQINFLSSLQAVGNTVVMRLDCKFEPTSGERFAVAFFRELYAQTRRVLPLERWPIRTVRLCDLYEYEEGLAPLPEEDSTSSSEDSF